MQVSYWCQSPGQVSMGRKGFAGNADAYPNISVLSKRQGLTTQRSTFLFSLKDFLIIICMQGRGQLVKSIPTFHFYINPKD